MLKKSVSEDYRRISFSIKEEFSKEKPFITDDGIKFHYTTR